MKKIPRSSCQHIQLQKRRHRRQIRQKERRRHQLFGGALSVQASSVTLDRVKANHESLKRKKFKARNEEQEDTLIPDVRLVKEAVANAQQDLVRMKKEDNKILKAEANRKSHVNNIQVQELVKVNQRPRAVNKLADVKVITRTKVDASEKKVFNPHARWQIKTKLMWEVGQEKKVEVVKPAGRDNSNKGWKFLG